MSEFDLSPAAHGALPLRPSGAESSSRFPTAWAFLVAVLALLGALLAYDRYDAYEDVKERERERQAQRTLTVETILSRRLQTTANALHALREDLPWLLGQARGADHLERRLKSIVASSFGLRAMLVVDRSGVVRHASSSDLVGADLHGEAHYRAIRDGNSPELVYVSAPFRTPAGAYTVALGKARQTAAGAFDGYLLAILDPENFFQVLMTTLLDGPSTDARMLHEDGGVVLRLPDAGPAPEDFLDRHGADFRQHVQNDLLFSAFAEPGLLSGGGRLFALRSIRPHASPASKDLIVAVSRDGAALFARWRHETTLRAGFFCGLGVLSALGLAVWQRRSRERAREREEAEAKLRQSHELMAMAERAAGAGAWSWDIRTRTMSWSEALYRLLGLDPNAPAGFETLATVIHPDDFPEVRDGLEHCVGTREPYFASCRALPPGSGERWIEAYGLPSFDADGEPVRFSGLCIDVTERRQADRRLFESEQRFRELFMHLPIAYQSLDIRGRWIDANQKMADLLGFETPQQMIGEDFSTFLEENCRSRFKATFESFKLKQNLQVEFQLLRRGGRLVSVLISGRAQRDKTGNFLCAHCIVVDISERRAAEDAVRALNIDLESKVAARTAELQQHKERLEETVLERTRELAQARDLAECASRAKSQLLANVGHELRTPLNAVIGINGILQGEVLSERSLKYLGKQLDAAHRLRRLVANLLDSVALESSSLRLKPTDFDLGELLARVASDARARLAAKGLTLELERDGSLPQGLHCDVGRLAEVLGELIDNAVKFSSAGPVTLRVRNAGVSGNLVAVRFEVEDRGIGIAPEDQAAIFDLFTQADGSSTRVFGGTGLGLALCKRIISLMAGDIGVESAPGRGSRFWFQVRLARATLLPAGLAFAASTSGGAAGIPGELQALLRARDRAANDFWKAHACRLGPWMGELREPFEDALESGDHDMAAELLDTALAARRA